MSATRVGSAILLCLALAAMAVMVGYAFLRAATRQSMSGKTEMLIALARQAAEGGLAHATEQILIDYNTTSLEIATGSGKKTLAPPTFLDGPYRAPFVSLENPGRILYTQHAGATYYDDVGEENHQLMPCIRLDDAGYSWWQEWDARAIAGGCIIYDARGRYIEVNYHPVTRPDPAVAAPVPVATLRFTDLAAAVPERSDGLFLDADLRRLSSGTPAEQRRTARYRLRYAVGVEDLNGHFLSNPRADMNLDWRDAANDYRNIPPWLTYASCAWDNMTALWAPCRATSLRLAHMLQGRGSASNVDRAWAAGASQGLPAAFPRMFRMVNGWHGNFDFDCDGSTPEMGGRLYAFAGSATYPKVDPRLAGGQTLTPRGQSQWAPYAHALLGPQHSWFNQTFAVQGVRVPGDRNDTMPSSDGPSSPNPAARGVILNTLTTPFGRRVEFNPTGGKWYHGRVDTPWQINLLTCPAQVVNEMTLGYIPPHLKWVHYYREQYYKRTGVTYSGDIDPNTGLGKQITYIFDQNEDLSKRKGIDEDYKMPGYDLWTELLGKGFSEFPAPSSYNAADGQIVKPDYYQTIPYTMWDAASSTLKPIPLADRYPGPLMRGASTNADEGYDDLGKYIDTDAAYGQGLEVGWCTHTYNPLMYQGGGDQSRWDKDPPDYLIIKRIDPKQFTFRYSYWYDLTRALTVTVSFAKANWVQYPNTVFEPQANGGTDGGKPDGFASPDLRDAEACNSIEKIDRLFLRQLGENPDVPGTRHPLPPIIMKPVTTFYASKLVDNKRYHLNATPVSQTIRTLVGDCDLNGNGVMDPPDAANHVIEDLNGDGVYNPGEDANGNGLLDPGEDRNPDGQLDPGEDRNGNGVLDGSEDVNDNGLLDPGEDRNPDGMLQPGEDLDKDGVLDPGEDKGNGVLDGDEDTGDGVLNSLIDTGHGVAGHERAKVMERMLNDFRMSFFGASPQYRDFRPLDFDADGKVMSSAYARNPAATANEVKYRTDRWQPSGPDGKGPKPADDMFFTVTGCFFIGKSHYYRVWTRGEVYDNLLQKPVSQQSLETVLAVDPEGPLFPVPGRTVNEARVLYKNWLYNAIRSELPLQSR